MKLKTIKSIPNLKGKRVLVRVDFNVPLKKGGKIDRHGDLRLRAALPTIRYLIKKQAKIILLTHLGRPEKPGDPDFKVDHLAKKLGELLGKRVLKVDCCIGEEAKEVIVRMKNRDVILLENIRFEPGEGKNDPVLAKKLASLADLYINDAFSVAHREHASVVGVTKYLSSFAGFLLEKEVVNLKRASEKCRRPLVGIIGGAKISTKLAVVQTLLKKVDYLLLGGALANTVLRALGLAVGKSLIEEKMVEVLAKVKLTDNKLRVPIDVYACSGVDGQSQCRQVAIGLVKDSEMIFDIGQDTQLLYDKIIHQAKTIIWNGPMGLFEKKEYARGTMSVIESIYKSKAQVIVGGGETIKAINGSVYKKLLTQKRTFVSTGGGAMLKFLEGKVLPGVKPLLKS